MQDNIFIPKKIKIGFQKRDDTYTQKLAYVIYYDAKNKLRKEQSWNSWRDKKIGPQDFDNTPTPGFVLNKKVGGYKYDWNPRNTYVRVYDPRGFEFEISVPNLLFILENTNSIKGKGLEGDFVYGWAGTELLLIPTCSPQYAELSKLNDLRHSNNHIKSKDLVIGATYLHKSNTPMVYMGRFPKYFYERWYSNNKSGSPLGEHYFFIVPKNNATKDVDDGDDDYGDKIDEIKTFKSLSNFFLDVVDGNCISNYADLMEDLEKNPMYAPISKTEYVAYSLPEFTKALKKNTYNKSIHLSVPENCTADCDYIECWVTNYSGQKIRFQETYGHKYSHLIKKRTEYDTIEQMHKELSPYYKNTYLINGKLFATTK